MNYFYEIALSLVSGIGPIKAKNLIRYCGSAEAVFTEKKSHLLKIPEVGEFVVKAIAEQKVFERVEKELTFIDKEKIDVLYYQDAKFPKRLLHCPDHPLILYKKGNMNLDEECVVSIVGTRNASSYGKRVTEELVEYLKARNVLIVSGLAYGIDVTAHKKALDTGIQTVGVVAHGLDQIYPKTHSTIANQMKENGGLLTEFISGGFPDRENFPKRNRIVAGLCDATVVIESKKKGGSLITGMLAADYNRDVHCVPGRVGDINSEGCNSLIQRNLGAIYTGPEEFIKSMGWSVKSKNKPVQQMNLLLDLNQNEEQLITAVQEQPKIRKDELSFVLGMSTSELSIVLLNLELKGLVKSLPGGVVELTFA
ncbi:MAG: DNA-processing protein DprA [Salibacteraceae bacterium]